MNDFWDVDIVEEEKFISVPQCTLSMNYQYKELTHKTLHYAIVRFSQSDDWRSNQYGIDIAELDEDSTDEDFA